MAKTFRYRRLGYVVLNVSDISRSKQFYTEFLGLVAGSETPSAEHLFRCTSRHHDIALHEAAEPGLRRVGWEMEGAGDVAAIRSHLGSLGIKSVDVAEAECAALGIQDGFRITEPNTGATFEYYHSMVAGEGAFEPSVAKIERVGHVVFSVADHAATERFFSEELGFRASDRIEGTVTFMRCFPNPLHHSLGLGNSPRGTNSLNHVNFMVTDVDDIGRALWRMKKAEVPIVFGPGRHPPSDSMFLYFLDPDGLTLEYSFGMEEFPEDVTPREPRLLPPGLESIDYWGAIPSPEFAARGAIEPLTGAKS